jgi:hypothetical protein
LGAVQTKERLLKIARQLHTKHLCFYAVRPTYGSFKYNRTGCLPANTTDKSVNEKCKQVINSILTADISFMIQHHNILILLSNINRNVSRVRKSLLFTTFLHFFDIFRILRCIYARYNDLERFLSRRGNSKRG